MIYEREQHDGQVMSHYWIGTGVRAITLCRPSGLSLLRVSALRAAAAIARSAS
jgi:hypothetical protein